MKRRQRAGVVAGRAGAASVFGSQGTMDGRRGAGARGCGGCAEGGVGWEGTGGGGSKLAVVSGGSGVSVRGGVVGGGGVVGRGGRGVGVKRGIAGGEAAAKFTSGVVGWAAVGVESM